MKKIFLILFGMITILIFNGLNQNYVHAQSINGATIKSSITDENGKNVSGQDQLDRYSNYKVHWDWTIPDNVPVDGNQIKLQLPHNVMYSGDGTSFPIINDHGQNVGMFSINKGSNYGTLIFNNGLDHRNDRHGVIELWVNGTKIDPFHKNWFINKLGWVANQNNTITWNVSFNPNLKKINHVDLQDTLGAGQTYVNGSLKYQIGTYDDHGNFIPDSNQDVSANITNNNPQIDLHFNNVINHAINLTYQVKIDGKRNDYGNEALIHYMDVTNNSLQPDSHSQTAMVSSVVKTGGDETGNGSIPNSTTPSNPNGRTTTPNHPDNNTTPNQPNVPNQPNNNNQTPNAPNSGTTTPNQPNQPTTPSQPNSTTPSNPSGNNVTPNQPSTPNQTPSKPNQSGQNPVKPAQPSSTKPHSTHIGSVPSHQNHVTDHHVGSTPNISNQPSEQPSTTRASHHQESLPQTGDNTHYGWMTAIGLTLMSLALLILFGIKFKNHKS
ncbi:hypothetical protein WR164_03480 [Philodulcilactobacillus myokoensis]|uniref:Gram-positive cocci surface proteins LPxTG domain-containing protein n=1 Tax=Philodulcilactobacillus myokoensis TaxID=2929573 RepID=A0A9W6AZN7_9LACO|nr:collagen binding domain-containing protein [Philodulcilactobacillus myokoensis]GLB46369.1 hypothetical protein WR164_03480 [Philodulcilactobacillus myokoensis]